MCENPLETQSEEARRVFDYCMCPLGYLHLGHLSYCAKVEFDITYTYRTLGLDTPEYVAIWRKVIINHLAQAFWFALIGGLIFISIFRQRKSN